MISSRILTATFVLAMAGCESSLPSITSPLTGRFQSQQLAGCIFASPVAATHGGAPVIMLESSAGEIVALDPDTGASVFSTQAPAPAGQAPNITSTPALFGNELVVAWQDADTNTHVRQSHHVEVFDVGAGAFDASFADVTLAGTQGGVSFLPSNAFSRSAIALAQPADKPLGYGYVSFGNIQDLQPWHGWVFELDLDAWKAGGSAVSGRLITTASNDCGTAGASGADEMLCGGGVWAPSGVKVFSTAEDFDVVVPTGNGLLDPTAGGFANTMMRSHRGLAFDPACDASACAGWDETNASVACEASCGNLFIPRLRASDPVPQPAGGVCAGKSFFECYAALDWDLGANSPARATAPDGTEVLVVPAKDGGVYLADYEHFGTLYDRVQVVAVCGSDGGSCAHDWAGMMVTEPAVTSVNGAPVVLVPTFVFDQVHPAGLVALEIVMSDGHPAFQPLWNAPAVGTEEATRDFREHEGRVTLAMSGGEEVALLVDVDSRSGAHGYLYVVRVRDGQVLARQPLSGAGMRYVKPLVIGDGVFVSSCVSDQGPGGIDAFTLAP
jgi:outer membrane protein assembly factor BamB